MPPCSGRLDLCGLCIDIKLHRHHTGQPHRRVRLLCPSSTAPRNAAPAASSTTITSIAAAPATVAWLDLGSHGRRTSGSCGSAIATELAHPLCAPCWGALPAWRVDDGWRHQFCASGRRERYAGRRGVGCHTRRTAVRTHLLYDSRQPDADKPATGQRLCAGMPCVEATNLPPNGSLCTFERARGSKSSLTATRGRVLRLPL